MANPFSDPKFGNDVAAKNPFANPSFGPSTMFQRADDAISSAIPKNEAPAEAIDPAGVAAVKAEEAARSVRVDAARAARGQTGLVDRHLDAAVGGMKGAIGSGAEYVGRFMKERGVPGGQAIDEYGAGQQEAGQALSSPDPAFSEKLAAGAGSLGASLVVGGPVGAVARGIVTGAKVASPFIRGLAGWAGPAAAAGQETLGNAQQIFDDAMRATGNKEHAEAQAMKSIPVNMLISTVTDKLGVLGGIRQRVASKAYADALHGGAVVADAEKAAIAAASKVKFSLAKDIAVASGAEGFQEGAQQITQNVLGHNPVGQGVSESAAIGAILGGAVGGARSVADGRRAEPAAQSQPQPDAQDTTLGLPSPDSPSSTSDQLIVGADGVARPITFREQQAQMAGLAPTDERAPTREPAIAPDPLGLPSPDEPMPGAPLVIGQDGVATPMTRRQFQEQARARQIGTDNGLTPDVIRAQQPHQEDVAAVEAALEPGAGPLTRAAGDAALSGATQAARTEREAVAIAAADQEQTALAEQDQKAQEQGAIALQQQNEASETAMRTGLLQSVLSNKSDAEPTKTFTERIGETPSKEELQAIKHEISVRDQAAKETEQVAHRRALESAAAQATRERAPAPQPALSPARAQSPAQPASTQPLPAESSSSPAAVPTESLSAAPPAQSGESLQPSAALARPAPPQATAAMSSPSAAPSQEQSNAVQPESSEVSSQGAAPGRQRKGDEPLPVRSPDAASTPDRVLGRSAEADARGDRAGAVPSSGANGSTGPRATANEALGLSPETVNSLKSAHETLVKSKGQITPLQRRVIDSAVTEAARIRAGAAPSTPAYVKGLKAKADTIAKWDPKAAAAVHALADHVETMRKPVDRAAHQAATSPRNDLPEPTNAQKEAGNYRKGHVNVGGLDVSIENPAGSKRRPEWPTLRSHYGYLKRTEGADEEHIDVFLRPGTAEDYSGPVFIVDQQNQRGGFDEHKVMIGWPNRLGAIRAYAENYTKGWKVGPVTQMSIDEFNTWLASGKTHEPTKGYVSSPDVEPLAQGEKGSPSRSVTPLEKITVKVKALEAETGKHITMTAPAHTVIADLHQQIKTARAILSCL